MRKYDIAAFVWPSYTGDELRSRMFWPKGEGEWQTVRTAEAKFEGHTWPRKPLWGYLNEADPEVMQVYFCYTDKNGQFQEGYMWYDYETAEASGHMRLKQGEKESDPFYDLINDLMS